MLDVAIKWIADGAKLTAEEPSAEATGNNSSDRNKTGGGGASTESKEPNKENTPLAQMLFALKKDSLTKARVFLTVEGEKAREHQILTEWEGNVQLMLESLAERSDGDRVDAAGVGSAGAAVSEEKNGSGSCSLSSLILSASSCRHWDAQCAAASLTAFIMANFGKTRQPNPDSLCSLLALHDETGSKTVEVADSLDGIFLHKKKLGLRRVADSPDEDAEWRQQVLNLRLAFCGRVVVVPSGQPPSFLKTKIHMPSQYFHNLGFTAYIVPIMSQPTVDVACKSPVFVPAWSIRTDKKKPNMKFASMKLSASYHGQTIDFELPILKIDKEILDFPNSYVEVKKDPKDDVGVSHLHLDTLSRPLTDEELKEDENREKLKAAKAENKKRKAEELSLQYDGFDGDGNEVLSLLPGDAGADVQLDIDSNLLKHILRWAELRWFWDDAFVLGRFVLFIVSDSAHSWFLCLVSQLWPV